MALACARHGTACIDSANFRAGDPKMLMEEIDRVRELGFHGKATVHPRELSAINWLCGLTGTAGGLPGGSPRPYGQRRVVSRLWTGT